MFGNGFAPVVRSWWLGTLVAAVAAGALPAGAAASPDRPRVGERPLEPAAGWHGRAIVKVHRHRSAVVASATPRPSGWSAGPVALGAGLSTPKGSRRVREIQRRLKRLGYDPGPVDGRFGRRTQAAVGWFQLKHGMRVTGVATAVVVRHVRARGHGEDAGGPSRAAEPERPRTAPANMPARELPTAVTRAARDDGTAWWWAAGAAAAALVLLALGLWRFAPRGRGDEAPTVYELWAEGHSPDPEIGGFRGVVKAVSVPDEPRPRGWTGDSQYLVEDPTRAGPFWVPATAVEDLGAARQEPTPAATGHPRAIGYLNIAPAEEAGGRAETSAAGEAMDEACRERDWELIQIVRDNASTPGHRSERPGLSFALERVAAGEASCLVVGRLGHLARSVTELGGLLDWFTEHEATLLICDIELDTSTTTGRRSAQTLAAVSAWERARSDEHDHAQ
jgi:peptidoglycan hydrolase-like protein with peptidoglycan-binding domain